MQDPLLTIGELSKRTGVATSALRYYEELGIMPSAQRVSGRRGYGAEAVDVVGLILLLRDVGFSLSDMKEFLASPSESAAGWRELVRCKFAELEEKISRMQAAKVALQHALQCEHQDLVDCPNFASVLAARLAGGTLSEAHVHYADAHR